MRGLLHKDGNPAVSDQEERNMAAGKPAKGETPATAGTAEAVSETTNGTTAAAEAATPAPREAAKPRSYGIYHEGTGELTTGDDAPPEGTTDLLVNVPYTLTGNV